MSSTVYLLIVDSETNPTEVEVTRSKPTKEVWAGFLENLDYTPSRFNFEDYLEELVETDVVYHEYSGTVISCEEKEVKE